MRSPPYRWLMMCANMYKMFVLIGGQNVLPTVLTFDLGLQVTGPLSLPGAACFRARRTQVRQTGRTPVSVESCAQREAGSTRVQVTHIVFKALIFIFFISCLRQPSA